MNTHNLIVEHFRALDFKSVRQIHASVLLQEKMDFPIEKLHGREVIIFPFKFLKFILFYHTLPM